MKRALAVLLCAVLLLGLAGCGKTDDANLGTYNCISVKLNGAELGTEGEYIELKAGGAVTIFLIDSPDEGKWKLSGDKLTLTIDGSEYAGTLSGGVIHISIEGADCVFAKGGAAAAASAAESAAASVSEPAGSAADETSQLTLAQIWPDKWYGSIQFPEAWGSYASYKGMLLNVLAYLNISAETPFFELYLPDNGYNDNPILSISIKCDENHLELDPDAGDSWFTDMTIPSEYVPDYYMIYLPDHGNLVTFGSEYDAVDGSKSGFKFTVEMRPYGSVWDESYDDVPKNYSKYLDAINGSECEYNVTDGNTGEVLVDRGKPLYVPGVPYPTAGGTDTGGDAAGAEASEPESTGGGAGGVQDGRATSRDGYFSFAVPAGWDPLIGDDDGNQVSASNDDIQITMIVSYLNGYTAEEMAKRMTYSTDTYDYDTTIPLGTTTVDGKTAYYAGPAVSFGQAYYYLIVDWGDGQRYADIHVQTLGKPDTAGLAQFLTTQTWKDALASMKLNLT